MKKYVLLLDMGGTEIKVNALTEDNTFLLAKAKHYPSFSNQSKSVIISHIAKIIKETTLDYEEKFVLQAIGFSFPGPFDYQHGISLMQDLRKYDSLYQVNLKEALENELVEERFVNVPFVFENDATCFALGEYIQSENVTRGIYLTLGTGCGSTFIEDGKVVKEGYGLNEMGMIYDTPYLDGQIDDYLSIAGLKQIAVERHYPYINGLALFEEAEKGNQQAQDILVTFGKLISHALTEFIDLFEPNEVVFGGQVSKSFKYFKEGLIQKGHTKYKESKDTSESTFYGLAYTIIKEIGAK